MAAIGRIAYRVRQFFRAIAAATLPWQPPDLSEHLTDPLLGCFRRMSRADQRHCLAVWWALHRDGVSDEVLLQAALLHDVGKAAAGVTVWHRAITVLLEGLAPGALAALAADRPGSWRYPFYLGQIHAERGAAMAGQAGALPLAVELIRWHHVADDGALSPELRWRLVALKGADEAN